MSVLTLHFKDEILSETGEPAGKTRNVEVIGAFVEGNALIMGLSAEITAFVPLDQLTWASIYEGEVSGVADEAGTGSDGEAADEGASDDVEGASAAEGGSVIPILGKGVSPDEGAGS